MADEELEFQAGAFGVVGSWLLGGVHGAQGGGEAAGNGRNAASEPADQEEEEEARRRRPVQLYRATAASDKPSLTGRSSTGRSDAMLTEEQRELRRKVLRRPGGAGPVARSTAERVAASVKLAAEESEKALDREEEALVRYKKEATTAATGGRDASAGQAVEGAGKKRKLNAQEELLEKLRAEAARKKAKNLKAKLRQQRKKQLQKQQQ